MTKIKEIEVFNSAGESIKTLHTSRVIIQLLETVDQHNKKLTF